jgi:hypothetical protein
LASVHQRLVGIVKSPIISCNERRQVPGEECGEKSGADRMSWDIFVQDLPPEAKTVGDIPTTFIPGLIGKRTEIIRRITEVISTARFHDPAWGTIDGDDWSIEVNMGSDEECTSFALHIRGGDAAVGAVATILQNLKLRALDSQTGDFFVGGPEAIDSFRRWRSYRDGLGIIRNS